MDELYSYKGVLDLLNFITLAYKIHAMQNQYYTVKNKW